MLDPVVRNKVEMTKNTDDLLVHIDKTHLVKSLGGASDWTWKYPPVVPGENAPQLYVFSLVYKTQVADLFPGAATCKAARRCRANAMRLLGSTRRQLARGPPPRASRRPSSVSSSSSSSGRSTLSLTRTSAVVEPTTGASPLAVLARRLSERFVDCRNGNIVGNGLVFFEYPSGEEQRSEGEWEVQGYDTCREQALLAMAQTQQELKKMK